MDLFWHVRGRTVLIYPSPLIFLARHLLDGIRSAMLGLMLRVQFPSSALWAQLMLAET